MESIEPIESIKTHEIKNLNLINNSYPGFKVNDHIVSPLIEKIHKITPLNTFAIDPDGSELIFIVLRKVNNLPHVIIIQRLSDGVFDIVLSSRDKIPTEYHLHHIFILNLPDNSLHSISVPTRKYLSEISQHFSKVALSDEFITEITHIPEYDSDMYMDEIVSKVIQNPRVYLLDVGSIDERGINYRKFRLREMKDESKYVVLNIVVNNVPIKIGIFRERTTVPDYAVKFNAAINKIKKMGFSVQEEVLQEKFSKLRAWQKQESFKMSPPNMINNPNMKTNTGNGASPKLLMERLSP